MADAELREWALARYGSTEIANDPVLAQRLHEDVETIERVGHFPAEDQRNPDLVELSERLRLAGLPPIPESTDRRTAV
jgi:hypothetical protein